MRGRQGESLPFSCSASALLQPFGSSMLRTLLQSANRISEISGVVAALTVAPLILALCYEVISRYAFGAPTAWAYELSYFLTGTILMLGISYALKHKQHVNVDLLRNLIPGRWNALIDLLGYVLLIAAAIPFTYRVGVYALNSYWSGETSGSSAWNPVIWPFRTIWVIGLALFCLQLIAEIIRSADIVFFGDRGGGNP